MRLKESDESLSKNKNDANQKQTKLKNSKLNGRV